MVVASASIQERRRSTRCEGSPQLAINLVQPHRGAVPAASVNFSEGGLCLRVRESLDVRSLIRLQLTPATTPRAKPLHCTGRVTWVVQRLDLRAGPPFLFDVGVELVDPPPLLRRFLVQRGGAPGAAKPAASARKWLIPSQVRGHEYAPRLERSAQPGHRWRLVVTVEGIPCFSEHYPSDRAAAAGWTRFKRRQGKR